MAFNAQGVWVDEDADVVGELNRITSENSDYIRQARQAGVQTANRRGLLNSSISAGASQGAAIERAAPLAQQNAANRAQRNLAALGARFDLERQREQITSTEGLAARELASLEQRQRDQLASTERLAGQEITSREGMLQLELNSRSALQQAQLESDRQLEQLRVDAQRALTERQLSSQELQQLRDITARQGMLSQELDAQFRNLQFTSGEERTRLQMQLANELERTNIASRTDLQRAAMEGEQRLQQIAAQGNIDLNLQELARLSDQQKSQLAAFVDFNNQYTNAINNLYANKDMPQPTRDAAINMFTQLRNANIDYAKVVFGSALDWGTGTNPKPPGTGGDFNPPPNPGPNSGPTTYDPSEVTYRNGRFYLADGTEVPRDQIRAPATGNAQPPNQNVRPV